MSLGDRQRDALRKVVQDARDVLTVDLQVILERTYGIHRSGKFDEESALPTVQADSRTRETWELLRRILPPPASLGKADRKAFEDRYDGLVRELAYTHLNRVVAFKLMEHESRKIIKQTVGPRREKLGLAVYMSEDVEREKRWNAGERYEVYREFLLAQCASLHREIGVLFDPDDVASRVFPQSKALFDLLDLVNAVTDDVWLHEESLGWVYQYYTPKELRDRARKESPAPRNGYEMAFRNQFYTPDYVVRFLADNTLGRLWLEMKPETVLREKCSYLLVAPDEESLPRAKKDPREILVLDPACGSGHFLLYAFDLLFVIYTEAYADASLGVALRRDWPDLDAFVRAIPKLIVEFNLHGIDIDRRATQIASLALFLKAKGRDRTTAIERGNILCAEPLAGSDALFEDFKKRQLASSTGTEARILDAIRAQLALAGEVGSLLTVDEAIANVVRDERKRWSERVGRRGEQMPLLVHVAPSFQPELDFSDVSEVSFWVDVEDRIVQRLREYAQEAAGAAGAERRMFARDGVEGLRFVDAMRRRYDVVLMNPPFGEFPTGTPPSVRAIYNAGRNDVFAAMVLRGLRLVVERAGYVGAITSRSFVVGRDHRDFREVLLGETGDQAHLSALLDLGMGVLDGAMVEVCAYTIAAGHGTSAQFVDARMVPRDALPDAALISRLPVTVRSIEELRSLPDREMLYQATADEVASLSHVDLQFEPKFARVTKGLSTGADFRFARLRWEVSPAAIGERWRHFIKGGDYNWFGADAHMVVLFDGDGLQLAAHAVENDDNVARTRQSSRWYGKAGAVYSRRSNKGFSARRVRKGLVFSDKSVVILPHADTLEHLSWITPILASSKYQTLIGTQSKFGSYETRIAKRLPLPPKDATGQRETWLGVFEAIDEVDAHDETCALFTTPPPVGWDLDSCYSRSIEHARKGLARCGLAVDGNVEARHLAVGRVRAKSLAWGPATLSYALGAVFGRFDIRVATGARPIPDLPAPWAPIERFSPGMLTGSAVPQDYPIEIDSDGILVDDESHEDDIVVRVRDVLRAMFGDRAVAVEEEAVALVRAQDLREWFVRPGAGGFWAQHVGRYSRSKRRAPVYWLLQSPARTYSVWLYLHRLDRDTLYKILDKRYLGGRLDRVERRINELRPAGRPRNDLGRAEADELERLDDIHLDLVAFRERLLEVANKTNDRGEPAPYTPNLDDGVVINAAPLHALIPWPHKKKRDGRSMSELEKYWLELADGDYDWSHLAMHYWPTRVVTRCKSDRSLAIAHELDAELFPGLRGQLKQKIEESARRADPNLDTQGEFDADEDDDEYEESEP